ncbi:MAG: tRNA 4-thiouridine(8) synthase ThiI [Ruminococcaceae bacterium]|nr:tRNA 4-thiouridine(8) synthase ThiI [Oscillospiraceae bacterium]
MKEIILIKNGELALKGLNRRTFEDMMIKNMRRRFEHIGKFTFKASQSTIMVESEDENADFDTAFEAAKKVFGIAGLSRAAATEKDIEKIKEVAKEYLEDELMFAKTFKVNAKRSDKKFPLKSPEICMEVGGFLLENFPHLTVDVHNPDIIVTVEVRDTHVYIHGNQHKGAGGMPVGSAGKAALLISGGIDSPVAGWMMAKRGLRLMGIHFAAPPYTSELAEKKVHELTRKVAAYSGRIKLYIVEFTKIQETIKDECPEELFTIIMRRIMMKTAEKIARREDCEALITGESLGQVASQTMKALACTDRATDMPVFRPCIGMDKGEIVKISREIDSFETSILPYEDCCTVFTPKHPKTRPSVEEVEKAESAVDFTEMIEEAVNSARFILID